MNKLFAVQILFTGYSSKPPEKEYIRLKKGTRIDTTSDINQAAWYAPRQAQAIAYDCNKRFSGGEQQYKAQAINVFTHPNALIER